MNTLHFKYAVEIEKTRSITQAAENLFMAQPNLSKAIKELENTLGITIFKRTSKGVIPTEQGVKFLGYAKQVLIQLDNMEAIHSPDKSQRQKMRISAPRASYILKAFSDFVKELSDSENIDAYIRETNSIQTIADVREQSYDFGIIRFRTEYERYFMDYLTEKSLDTQVLWDFEAYAVMSCENSASAKKELDYSDFAFRSVEVMYGDDSVPYLHESRSADKAIQNCSRIYVFDRGSALDTLHSLKNSFMLSSPMPESELEKTGLVQRKCRFNGNKYRDLLVYSSGHTLSESEILLVNRIYSFRNESAFI